MTDYSNQKTNCKRSLNSFFDNITQYNCFVNEIKEEARHNNLPITFEVYNPMEITMEDIQTFSKTFKKDTDLYMDFRLYTCSNCDRLHCIIFIDSK